MGEIIIKRHRKEYDFFQTNYNSLMKKGVLDMESLYIKSVSYFSAIAKDTSFTFTVEQRETFETHPVNSV